MTASGDDDLVAAWTADELGETEAAALAARLRADPALARRLADQAATDHALRVLHGSRPGADEFLVGLCARLPVDRSARPRPSGRHARPRRRPARPWWIGMAAVAAALVLAVALPGGPAGDPPGRLLDAARVEPPPGADGVLAPGSRIRADAEPVRIRVDARTTLTLAPHSAVQAERPADGRVRWTVADGLLTLATTGTGPIPALDIATAHGRATVTGTILHVTTGASVSRFAVERGSVRIQGPGGRSTVLGAGGALHAGADGAWSELAGDGSGLRAVGALLCDPAVAARYLRREPLLGDAAGPAGPSRRLDAAWLRGALRHDGDLRPSVGDDGAVECPPGTGTLAIDLPEPPAAGFRLAMQVRLDPAPGGTPMVDTDILPGPPLPSPFEWSAGGPAAGDGPGFGVWIDAEIRAVRIGRSAAGDPAWEVRLARGRTVVGGWSAGERPRLVWRLAGAGLALRGLAWSKLAGP